MGLKAESTIELCLFPCILGSINLTLAKLQTVDFLLLVLSEIELPSNISKSSSETLYNEKCHRGHLFLDVS